MDSENKEQPSATVVNNGVEYRIFFPEEPDPITAKMLLDKIMFGCSDNKPNLQIPLTEKENASSDLVSKIEQRLAAERWKTSIFKHLAVIEFHTRELVKIENKYQKAHSKRNEKKVKKWEQLLDEQSKKLRNAQENLIQSLILHPAPNLALIFPRKMEN